MSGGWVFGPSDVDELLFLLQDSPVNTSFTEGDELSAAMMARYRPSRIRAMFASRACRKAVMVGTALTPAKMKKYLEQLSQLKHPWVTQFICATAFSYNSKHAIYCSFA